MANEPEGAGEGEGSSGNAFSVRLAEIGLSKFSATLARVGISSAAAGSEATDQFLLGGLIKMTKAQLAKFRVIAPFNGGEA